MGSAEPSFVLNSLHQNDGSIIGLKVIERLGERPVFPPTDKLEIIAVGDEHEKLLRKDQPPQPDFLENFSCVVMRDFQGKRFLSRLVDMT